MLPAILILKPWWDCSSIKSARSGKLTQKMTYFGWFVEIGSLHQAKMRIAAYPPAIQSVDKK
jgi:hypothetical protein